MRNWIRASKVGMKSLQRLNLGPLKALLSRLKPRSLRDGLSLALVVLGVGLSVYVGGQYWGMYHTQRQLQAEWERQASLATVSPGLPKLSAEQMLTRVSI